MQSRIQKWGNSLAVRLPKAIADEIGLTQDATVELQVEDGAVVIRPISQIHYNLEDLLAHVTDDNRHGETNKGGPIGREIW